MNGRTLGFVGGGRVARILLGGWRRAGWPLDGIVVSDIDRAALQRVSSEFPSVTTIPDNQRSAAADIVLIAVHPPAVPESLAQIRSSLKSDAIVVSLAPKWTISRMSAALGGFRRLARVIPNAPSIVNKGYNPVSVSEDLPRDARAEVLALFAPLGACPEVAEDTLEAYAIVSAMGPTYLWYQLYHLAELGCQFGLTREAADTAVAAMVNGAVDTMVRSGLRREDVIDLIPVKPLAALEPTVTEGYVRALSGLHQKLKG
jgi:pyrroline-5-carboxylate reductase